MSVETFSSEDAINLLNGKSVYIFGDSNMRALYKDLIWLVEVGSLIPEGNLKKKNEHSHACDQRLSNGTLHSGRNYEEIRYYRRNPVVYFEFITRLYLNSFIDTISNLIHEPDVVIISSCLWDLTRWGSSGTEHFKKNVVETFKFLKRTLPLTRIIWLTTLPPSFQAEGGFLTAEIKFTRKSLPWQISFANSYVAEVAKSFEVDVIDLNYHFVYLMHLRSKDGIHWQSKAVRFATNLILTHLKRAGLEYQ